MSREIAAYVLMALLAIAMITAIVLARRKARREHDRIWRSNKRRK